MSYLETVYVCKPLKMFHSFVCRGVTALDTTSEGSTVEMTSEEKACRAPRRQRPILESLPATGMDFTFTPRRPQEPAVGLDASGEDDEKIRRVLSYSEL